jgi:putative transposase
LRVEKLIADKGYDSEEFIKWVKSIKDWDVEISEKLTETVKKGFVVQPFRWIVERTFAWFNHSRRLVKNYEVKIEHSASMIHLSMIRLMLNRIY